MKHFTYEKLADEVNCLSDWLKYKEIEHSILTTCGLMNLMAPWSKMPNQLTHNVAFPCTHQIMSNIKSISQRFKSLPRNAAFASYNDLFIHLNR